MTQRVPDGSLIKRVAVAVIFIPLIVWILLVRGFPLYIFLVIITTVGQWELYSLFGGRIMPLQRLIGFCSGLAILTDAFLFHSAYSLSLLLTVIILLFLIEILFKRERKFDHVSLTLFITVYPALFLSFLFGIERVSYDIVGFKSRFILLFLVIMIWVFDTMSYFVGKWVGRHPFFPTISPGKTLEGFIGGFLSVIILGGLIGRTIDKEIWLHFVMLAGIIGIAGQVGDLAESMIKREVGVKDSSRILPGHGGILDRFDSLIFASPVAYWYLALMSGSLR